MLAISQYIRTLTGATLISTVILRLLPGKSSASTIGKTIVGIFMAFTVLAPIAQIELSDLWNTMPDISADADQAAALGQASSQKALAESISAQVEAYILDKAAQMDVLLAVEVELSDDPIPVPKKVRLQGAVSPYAKSKLQSIICQDLGIEKENQIWI